MRAAASEASVRDESLRLPLPPIRLRVLLLLALAYGAYALFEPRVRAAWNLHAQATALANYGACMAGPTGPALLRDRRTSELSTLVRRRLVATPAGEAPFEGCAGLAETLSGSSAALRAHRARASSFAEYGGNPRPEHTLRDLEVTPGKLAELARAAWPFAQGYAALVKPSLSRHEATHPTASHEPALGRGLPAARSLYRAARVERGRIVLSYGAGAHRETFESKDGGATFRPAPASVAAGLADRCAAPVRGRSFALGAGASGATTVLSLEPPNEPRAAELARDSEEIAALACDDGVLVAALRSPGDRRARLRQCAFGHACTDLVPPDAAGTDHAVDYPLDLARSGGATILALSMGHVVRVASIRDGGSWTPLSVAYDAGEHPLDAQRMPARLLTIGQRVLLHGTSPRPSGTYGLLYSDDLGASFRGKSLPDRALQRPMSDGGP